MRNIRKLHPINPPARSIESGNCRVALGTRSRVLDVVPNHVEGLPICHISAWPKRADGIHGEPKDEFMVFLASGNNPRLFRGRQTFSEH